jgi:DNA-binding beta-propeller fold protein YncE
LLAPIAMPAGLSPSAVPVVGAAHDRLYGLASGGNGGALVIIDTKTSARLHVTPLHDANLERLGYDAATNHLFVTGEQQGEGVVDLGTLTMLDAITGAVLHVARHFGSEPAHIAIDRAPHHLFAVDSPGRQVLMADTRSGALLRAIPVRDEPDVISSDAATHRIFVAHDIGALAILDAASGAVRGYTPIGGNPYKVVDDLASGHIFVVSESDDAVDVFADR